MEKGKLLINSQTKQPTPCTLTEEIRRGLSAIALKDWKTMSHTQTVTMHTTLGDIKINLFGNHAPKTVKNFLGLADGSIEWSNPRTGEKQSGPLYKDVPFHRVIAGFMIQGGDPLGNGTGGPGYKFADEFHSELVFDRPYLFAMANAGPGTNGSQFFITVAATAWLNMKHTIFGEVADQASRDVVDAIGAAATNAQDRPLTEILLTHVTIS